MLQSSDAERSTRARATYLPEPRIDQALGLCLKAFFDGVVATPIPDKMQQLAKALEDALDRGDLRAQDSVGSWSSPS